MKIIPLVLVKRELAPLVAIFTYHNPVKEKLGKNNHQSQGIAYSLDNGKTFTKYEGNPVLPSPGIPDFRDPKVFWHEGSSKWIMSLAAGDRIMFYSSPDLKTWQSESAFGEKAGAHGGVWECPDLFSLNYNGEKVWVLIVNLNPGGPNGGSATQYFLGDFDGKTFMPKSTETKWLDYGPDNYAGISWGNTGDRKLFLGWMSNWDYANKVPTVKWRSSMTIPRELALEGEGKNLRVTSLPVRELSNILEQSSGSENIAVKEKMDLNSTLQSFNIPCKMDIELNAANDFTFSFSNKKGEVLLLGFDKVKNEYFIDRSHAGKSDFSETFAGRHTAPRFSTASSISLSLVIDVASLELFADDGLTVMTSIFFPEKPFTQFQMESTEGVTIQKITCESLKSLSIKHPSMQ